MFFQNVQPISRKSSLKLLGDDFLITVLYVLKSNDNLL